MTGYMFCVCVSVYCMLVEFQLKIPEIKEKAPEYFVDESGLIYSNWRVHLKVQNFHTLHTTTRTSINKAHWNIGN